MCIRDRLSQKQKDVEEKRAELSKIIEKTEKDEKALTNKSCLLYTSDAADERSSVDLGGRRIIKKKKKKVMEGGGGMWYTPNEEK